MEKHLEELTPKREGRFSFDVLIYIKELETKLQIAKEALEEISLETRIIEGVECSTSGAELAWEALAKYDEKLKTMGEGEMKILLLLLLASCSTAIHNPIQENLAPNIPSVSVQTNETLKTPLFLFEKTPPGNYAEAISLISKHGNSDKFYAYMKTKRKYFIHTELSVDDAIKSFRKSLSKSDIINIVFYTNRFSKAIGGWNGSVISENTKFNMKPIKLAGHIFHEVSHKYGFKHLGNYKNKNDNINSFPYAIGIDFEDYLIAELSAK